ncbi:MAG TPA: MFS transporter [Kofleriaceae bacterium]|nr:MFS transporter [Kofleriaceae bacterium]
MFAIAALDELASGVPSSGAPDIERTLGLSHGGTTAILFLVPGLFGLVLDPVVFWLAERVGRPRMIRLGLAAHAVAAFAAAWAPGPVSLAGAMALWFVAAGAATGLSEAILVDAWPDRQARTMARWTLLSLIGDFAGPALVGVLATAIGGHAAWRPAFVVTGALFTVWTIATCARAFPAPPARADDDDEPPLWQAVRDALRDRVLIAWMFGTALCNLLDEILVVFASLHVRDDLGAGPAWQSVTIGAFVAGGALGLVALDRVLARWPGRERRALIATGAACAVAFAAWLAAPTAWLSALGMVGVGVTAAPLYPLASAQAYARRPGRASVVIVASNLFAPMSLALPWLLGLVADHTSVTTALWLLIAQPIGILALAITTGDRGNRGSRTDGAP